MCANAMACSFMPASEMPGDHHIWPVIEATCTPSIPAGALWNEMRMNWRKNELQLTPSSFCAFQPLLVTGPRWRGALPNRVMP